MNQLNSERTVGCQLPLGRHQPQRTMELSQLIVSQVLSAILPKNRSWGVTDECKFIFILMVIGQRMSSLVSSLDGDRHEHRGPKACRDSRLSCQVYLLKGGKASQCSVPTMGTMAIPFSWATTVRISINYRRSPLQVNGAAVSSGLLYM